MAAEAGRNRDSALPKRVGKYDAFLHIGAGGMARVYLASVVGAEHSRDLVVLKQLRRDVAEDEDALAMFVDEARIAMRLDHPNVVRVREVITEPVYAMVMDFLDGPSLLQVVERVGRAAMPRDLHVYVLREVLSGLAHAHELLDREGLPMNVVHRDVSPANVLVCHDGRVKLLDFGIAKATGSFAATHEGAVRGKVGYASPEQCLGKPTDARSDLYSVGVMLWEAVAGRRRATGETRLSLLQARIEDSEPSLDVVAKDSPPELRAIVARALAYSPDDRYRTAQELRTDLDAYLGKLSEPVDSARLAALLEPHFAEERAVVRRVVDAHFAARARSSSGTRPRVTAPPPPKPRLPRPPIPLVPKLPPPPVSLPAEATHAPTLEEDTSKIPLDDLRVLQSRSEIQSSPQVLTTATEVVVSRPPVELPLVRVPAIPEPLSNRPIPLSVEKARWRVPVIVSSLVVAAGALLYAVHERRGTDVAHDGTAPLPSAGAPTTPRSPEAPHPDEIRIRVDVTPRQATLKLDGRVLADNPFVGIFPKDGADHELTASAEGRTRVTRILRFEANLDVAITLDAAPARGAYARGGRSSSATTAPQPSRAVSEPKATAAPVEPGMDLDRKPALRPKHTIDEKDPYGP